MRKRLRIILQPLILQTFSNKNFFCKIIGGKAKNRNDIGRNYKKYFCGCSLFVKKASKVLLKFSDTYYDNIENMILGGDKNESRCD